MLTACGGRHLRRAGSGGTGPGPPTPDVRPLRAVIFDLDGAMADIEREGNREAFNAAFAAHALDIRWDEDDYADLLLIGDERQRIATDLRRRGFGAAAMRSRTTYCTPRTRCSPTACSTVTSRRARG